MTKRVMLSALVVSLSFSVVLPAVLGAQSGQGDAQGSKVDLSKVLCPVMDKPVTLTMSTETPDGPVYFCCAGCIDKYKAEPKKFAEKVAAQRKLLAPLAKVQVKCPITGNAVDRKVSAEVNGKTVYFCCADCIAPYKKDPAKYKTALANAYTHQTICPVMKNPIDPKSSVKLATGETIYFCCPGCDGRLRAQPAKFNRTLIEQGIFINWAEVKKAESGEKGHDDHDHDDHAGHDHGPGGHP